MAPSGTKSAHQLLLLVAFIASARLRLGLVHPSSWGPWLPRTSPCLHRPCVVVVNGSSEVATCCGTFVAT